MQKHFGDHFFEAFTPPFHQFNHHTLESLKSLGFKAISVFEQPRKDEIRHVHEISGNVDPVKDYDNNEFMDISSFLREIEHVMRHTDTVGIILHHKIIPENYMQFLDDFLSLLNRKNIKTKRIRDLYHEKSKNGGVQE